MKHTALHVLMLALFAGCTVLEPEDTEVLPPVDEREIEFSINTQEVYDVGEPAVAFLVNSSSYEVFISGECKGMLQHDDQGIWWPPEPVSCPPVGCDWTTPCGPPPDRLIPPGTTYADTLVSTPHPRFDFRYRYIYRITDRDGDLLPSDRTRTAPFVVRSPWSE